MKIGTAVATFYHGSGPIHYSRVACNGLEARLTDCSSGAFVSCHHGRDAGVRCHSQTGQLYVV